MMAAIRPGMIELAAPDFSDEIPRAKKRNRTITTIGALGIAGGAATFLRPAG
jgi:hypothetical protein